MRRPALAIVILAHGCGDAAMPGFSTGPGVTSSPKETTGDGSTGSSSGSSGGTSSTGGEGSAASGSTTLVLDVGGADLGDLQPEGCKGKIDFLFVISRDGYMYQIQAQLVDAFPKFIETIEAKFADFDYHIMVVDSDPVWGSPYSCTLACPEQPEPECVGYPCDLLDTVSACDETMGAGTVFNAGWEATNKPCEILGGHRYLTRGQPNLDETFACIARVGQGGYERLAEAMVEAVSPELNAPGGCNDGFLRDDALLVVTLATTNAEDHSSDGMPAEWAQAVIDAKGGNLDAAVMFGLGWGKDNGECHELDRICRVVSAFPYSHYLNALEDDYVLGFDVATDLIETACSKLIPQ